MQRKSYFKVLLSGLLYVVFASVLCTVMTLASAPFLGGYLAPTMRIILVLFTSIVYFALIFTAGWKDGQAERSFITRHKDESPRDNWLSIGFFMAIFASIPTIILLISRLFAPSDTYFMFYKFLCGPMYSWILFMLKENSGVLALLSPISPMIFIVYYMLIPIFTKLGFYVGYHDKFNEEKIMYK